MKNLTWKLRFAKRSQEFLYVHTKSHIGSGNRIIKIITASRHVLALFKRYGRPKNVLKKAFLINFPLMFYVISKRNSLL